MSFNFYPKKVSLILQDLLRSFRNRIKAAKASVKTYVRGIPLPNEKPLFRVTPYHVIAIAFLKLALSIGGTAWILSFHNFWALPALLVTQILGQSSIWMLYMISHQAIHDAISKRHKSVNKWVAEITSVIALTLPWEKYRKSHGFHHIPSKLATPEDPDFRWLSKWGFIPGQPMDYYWRQLWLTLLNPKYYAVFLSKRLQANFIKASPNRRLMAIAWWFLVFSITWFTQGWLTLLFGYLIPVIFGYAISSLFQTLTEHRWAHDGDPKDKTFARLLPVDDPNTSIWGHLFNLYWRETVLVTDLQQHQIHHYKPKNFEWPMVAYSQEAQNDLPDAVFGIRNHFRTSFESLSKGS